VAEPLDLRLATAKTFEPYLGTEFVSDDPPARFLLTDVTSLGVDRNAPRQQPFTLTFVGDAALAQQTYELEHRSLGRLDVFLVPIGPAPEGRVLYEAVFN
jgi:hypothetical protein